MLLLPHQLARVVASNDNRSSSSVIVGRHTTEFNKLFALKYAESFGEGVRLDAAKRLKRVDYYPASGSLLRGLPGVHLPAIPPCLDVLGKPSQFKPFVQIWEKCIESLREYNRVRQKTSDASSSEAYESLPTEIRGGEHPEEKSWLKAWEENIDADHSPILPVSALAKIKKFSQRERLTKTQCQHILQTADAIGFGVEPDARITGRNYQWDEKVTLFFLEGEFVQDPTRYAAASVLLRLGASIANADGNVDESELQYINQHLQGQFNLSPCEAKRLDRLQYLLLHSRTGENAIGKALAKRLSVAQRQLVGEFLVGIAASDQVISKAEVRALRKAYLSLELDERELDRLIDAHGDSTQVTEAGVHGELRLDPQAISRIMAETLQVATLIRDAMADDMEIDVDPISPHQKEIAAVSPENSVDRDVTGSVINEGFAAGLDNRYHSFLIVLLGSEQWLPSDLQSLAKEHGMMLSGAIEVINEWSTERFGDWLIEEGDQYIVRRHLIESN